MKRNNYPEIICFLIFCICTIFISIYHEPWRDEFQDLAISKDTLYNILFIIPHFDGHCPFWYLILKCFSFLNINPELSLKIPNLLFMFASVWLLIFKAPFKRIFRLSLPFTYFIFYQYSIVSRPYSIFCFGLFLAAYYYKKRDINPFKYASALVMLSLSSAFGMAISAGLILVWFIEIIRNKVIKDKRYLAILYVFSICLFIALICFPDKNTSFSPNGFNLVKFLYLLFGLPCDSLITNTAYYSPAIKINLFIVTLGIFIYSFLFSILKFYKSVLLFLIPYMLFLALGSLVYFCGHHSGLLFIFYIFIAWAILCKSNKPIDKKHKRIIFSLVLIPIFIQIYWSICAYYSEYHYNYSYSRELSQYIKENNLTKYNIMSYFSKHNYNIQYVPVTVIPYFQKNIFYNFNILSHDKEYIRWGKMNEEEKKTADKKIKETGFPEIIIGDLEFLAVHIPKEYERNEALNVINEIFLSDIFEVEKSRLEKYKVAKIIDYSQIWKNDKFKYILSVYIRNDIYNEIFDD